MECCRLTRGKGSWSITHVSSFASGILSVHAHSVVLVTSNVGWINAAILGIPSRNGGWGLISWKNWSPCWIPVLFCWVSSAFTCPPEMYKYNGRNLAELTITVCWSCDHPVRVQFERKYISIRTVKIKNCTKMKNEVNNNLLLQPLFQHPAVAMVHWLEAKYPSSVEPNTLH